jgi:hypothetical protein
MADGEKQRAAPLIPSFQPSAVGHMPYTISSLESVAFRYRMHTVAVAGHPLNEVQEHVAYGQSPE